MNQHIRRQLAAAFGVIISCSGCGHQKIMLISDNVNSVELFRGDEPYFRNRTIVNRDTIRQICTTLQLAEPVAIDTVNVRNSLQFCYVSLMNRNGSKEEFHYNVTAKDGKILWYRGNYYCLDALNQYLR